MDSEHHNRTVEIEVSILHVSPSGRANVLIAHGNDKVADQVNIASEAARKTFLTRLSNRFPGMTDRQCDEIETVLIDALKRQSDLPKAEACDLEGPDSAELLAEMPDDIRQEAGDMLADGMLMRRVLDDVAALGVAGERELVAAIYLIGTSRLLDRPLAAIIQGPSSSGKSYVIDTTTATFPPETVIHATQMTPQALFHMRPGSLTHRFVVAGERSRLDNDERAEATRAMREMISSGKLSKLMPVKVEGGRIETVSVEQDGPIAYVESTTLTRIFDEDANRCVLFTTDERPTQTRQIIKRVAAGCRGQADRPDLDRIIQRHQALHRSLQRLPVVIPYAERLGELFNSDRVEARRAFPQMLSMIQASALLHQRQRMRDHDGRLVAVEDDYQITLRLLAKPMARLLGGRLSDPAQRFFDRLGTWARGTFTTTDAVKREREHASDRAVRGWLVELHDAGLIELVEPSKGPKPAAWRLADAVPVDGAHGFSGLPSVEQLFSDGSFRPSGKVQATDTQRDTLADSMVACKVPTIG